jgi:uncharacterized membrane protein
MKKVYWVIIVLILLSYLISLLSFSHLPDQLASHWNSNGEVDRYSSKFWGAFLLPIIITAITLLFIAIPYIDPLKRNIEQFKKYYQSFVVIFITFMLLVHLQIILWNLNYKVSPNLILPLGIGFLMYYIGIMLKNSKRNWFIGIRTPWTLSSDKVWNKTHQLGAVLFKIAGVIAILGLLFGKYATWFILVPILSFALFLVVYSYFLYQKEKKH